VDLAVVRRQLDRQAAVDDPAEGAAGLELRRLPGPAGIVVTLIVILQFGDPSSGGSNGASYLTSWYDDGPFLPPRNAYLLLRNALWLPRVSTKTTRHERPPSPSGRAPAIGCRCLGTPDGAGRSARTVAVGREDQSGRDAPLVWRSARAPAAE
jgi:hypothetical protein